MPYVYPVRYSDISLRCYHFEDVSSSRLENQLEEALREAVRDMSLHHEQRFEPIGTGERVYESDQPGAQGESTDIYIWPQANMTWDM